MTYEANSTVHLHANGTLNLEEAFEFDEWVRKNGGKIRKAIATLHDERPELRKFHGSRVGPLVYALYERRHWYIR